MIEKTENNGVRECPLCGRQKRSTDWMCIRCYQIFVYEAGKSLATSGKILDKKVWLVQQLEAGCNEAANQIEKKRAELKQLSEKVYKEAMELIRKNCTKRDVVEKEVFFCALEQKKKILWGEQGGNKLYAILKQLEARITMLKGLLDGLKENLKKQEEVIGIKCADFENEIGKIPLEE